MNTLAIIGIVGVCAGANWALLRVVKKNLHDVLPSSSLLGIAFMLALIEGVLLLIVGDLDLWAGAGSVGHGVFFAALINAFLIFFTQHFIFRSDRLFKAVTEWLLPAKAAELVQQAHDELIKATIGSDISSPTAP